MPLFNYDFHIHSCLSPCGSEDMLPSNLVGMAKLGGLDVIALTDHNSCKNCKAAMKLGETYGIIVIPGMELTTSEEVHVVCLFPKLDNALDFSNYVYGKLPKIANRPDIFGVQQIVDEEDNVVGQEEKLLINATEINFDDVYSIVGHYGGLMMPAHVDKSSNSLLSNLGFIPPDSQFRCAEVKHTGFLEKLLIQHPYLSKCRIFTDSDAHYLEDISEPGHTLEAPSAEPADILNAMME